MHSLRTTRTGSDARDIAERLGIANSTVTRVEASERRDTIQLDMLRKYADAMDADLLRCLEV
jgi:transcriptional regulator with XRE-family HTH domain